MGLGLGESRAPFARNPIAALFPTGVNGAWYDPSDFSTLFQDAAGTTPVTAVGQPVGRILDKSGRGNHAFNPSGNSANFPVLQQDGTGRYYLAFNGVNQWLQTNSIDFSYGDNVFVSAGVRKLSDASNALICELSTDSNANNGAFYLAASVGSASYQASSRGTVSAATSVFSIPAPVTNVVSSVGDIAAPSTTLRVNGVQVAQSTDTQGTGNYGNYPLYIGARAGTSLYFNGRLHQLVIAGKQASASEIASTEAWLNQKTGAYEGTPGSLSLDLNFTDNTYYSRVI